MTWIRLKKSFTNKKGRKYPIGTKWNCIAVEAEKHVKSGLGEYCDKHEEKMKTQIFKPK